MYKIYAAWTLRILLRELICIKRPSITFLTFNFVHGGGGIRDHTHHPIFSRNVLCIVIKSTSQVLRRALLYSNHTMVHIYKKKTVKYQRVKSNHENYDEDVVCSGNSTEQEK